MTSAEEETTLASGGGGDDICVGGGDDIGVGGGDTGVGRGDNRRGERRQGAILASVVEATILAVGEEAILALKEATISVSGEEATAMESAE